MVLDVSDTGGSDKGGVLVGARPNALGEVVKTRIDNGLRNPEDQSQIPRRPMDYQRRESLS